MPAIELRVNNYTYRIDSSDPELIGKWFKETYERIWPHGKMLVSDFVQLTLYPLWIDGEPDWSTNTRTFVPIQLNKNGMAFLNRMLRDMNIDTGLVEE